jgi:hypothetical protein
MIRVRKCGNTIEFEFPDLADESRRPQRIHFGSEPEHDCLQGAGFLEKELQAFSKGVGKLVVGSLPLGR